MLQSTYLTLLVLAHVAAYLAIVRRQTEITTGGFSFLLFAILAVSAGSIQVPLDTQIETISQPGVGWYAFGMMWIMLALVVASALGKLPTPDETEFSHVNQR